MINPIFAKVTVLHKNGFRTDYTHVTEFKVYNPLPRIHPEYEPYILIKGESLDSFDMPQSILDKLPVKDLQMTIIDWHIPLE